MGGHGAERNLCAMFANSPKLKNPYVAIIPPYGLGTEKRKKKFLVYLVLSTPELLVTGQSLCPRFYDEYFYFHVILFLELVLR